MSEIANGAAGAWSYRAGGWYAVFGSNAVIVLPASQKDQVVGLWALVDGGAGFDEVLDGLLAAGLSKIPGFVLAGIDAGRFLLRGDGVVATLTTGAGDSAETVTVDGAQSHTWVERAVEGVTALSISLPAAETDEGTVDFPIDTGLVRVGRIDRPAVSGAPAAAPPAAEPAAAAVVAGAHLAEEPAPAPLDEPAPFDEPAPVEEPAAFDDSPATEVMEAIPDDIPDPLTDPIGEAPSEPAPEGWVTPWDEPTGPPPSMPAPSVPPPSMPPPPGLPPLPSDLPPVPPTPPPGWVPPPPPLPAEPEPAPAEPAAAEPAAPEQHDAPLTVGSWEPVGSGFPPPAPASDVPDVPSIPNPIDHDGFTVVGGEPPAPAVPGFGDQPAAPAGAQPVAKLLVSDGQSILVDRAVLIGRAPEARRFTSTEQPTLVTVPSRLHEISSTHVEVRPGTGADLGTAVVTDMGSTNGTVLVQPGLGPEDLKPGIAVQLIPGAIINLGDGVTIQVTRP
ncbi:hypothetical protein ACFQ3F_12630 [Nocardioides ginsengisoli]|uniref:FHA domain-containing protein n=2 Tax=Nocardioides ginsengisoli TaxID=363868 RepID=A0ABW3W0C5_9ACTN